MKPNFSRNGFTLVELAIVLMIIGLLIGGILKGQELITNARITSFIKQVNSLDAAVITFQDSYSYLPGDIPNPDTRLPNCSAAKCNTAGNGDGRIGTNGSITDENNAFWLHLSAANVISGIDMAGTWTSGNVYTFPYPKTALGGIQTIYSQNVAVGAPNALDGRIGHHTAYLDISAAGVGSNSIPTMIVGRIDRKMDDGHPFRGRVKLINDTYGVAYGQTDYSSVMDMSVTSRSYIKQEF